MQQKDSLLCFLSTLSTTRSPFLLAKFGRLISELITQLCLSRLLSCSLVLHTINISAIWCCVTVGVHQTLDGKNGPWISEYDEPCSVILCYCVVHLSLCLPCRWIVSVTWRAPVWSQVPDCRTALSLSLSDSLPLCCRHPFVLVL